MRLSITILFVALLTGTAIAQEVELRKKHFNTKKNIALEGFDPVSYFDASPAEGKEELHLSYKGIVYQFSSTVNLSKFRANPAMYEPAYGGWCAYAMGENGEKVKIDPETFTILDGKLYLFYNFWGNNTLKDWKEDEPRLKKAGDGHWKKSFR
jgi:YHS domain-containing protein